MYRFAKRQERDDEGTERRNAATYLFQLLKRLLIETRGFEVLLGVCDNLLDDREVDGTLYKSLCQLDAPKATVKSQCDQGTTHDNLIRHLGYKLWIPRYDERHQQPLEGRRWRLRWWMLPAGFLERR